MTKRIHEWADLFLKSKTEEMAPNIARQFIEISLGMPSVVTAEEVHAQAADLRDLGVEIIHTRSQHIGLQISGQVFALIRTISDSPGTIVMWLHALRSWQVRNGGRLVDMDLISMQLFPMGFPTRDALQAAWEAQKMESGGNFLDTCNAETFKENPNAVDG
jgi:hypothetical protein